MKIQITKNWFEIYSEKVLLLAGSLFLILGSFLGYVFKARFDGVLDMHFTTKEIQAYQPFVDNVINTACLFVALLIAGKAINKNTRIVDILTTALIGRCVLYVLPLFNINGYILRVTESVTAEFLGGKIPSNPLADVPAVDMIGLLAFTIISIALLALLIVVLYNGFKTAVNAKTTNHKVYFGLAVFAAEVVSKTVFVLFNF